MADRTNNHPCVVPTAYASLHEDGVHSGFSKPPTDEEEEKIVEDGNPSYQRDRRDDKEYPGEIGGGDIVDMLFDSPDRVDPELLDRYQNEFIPAMGYHLPLDENGKPEGLIPEEIDDEEGPGNEQGSNPETSGVMRLKSEFSNWLDGQDQAKEVHEDEEVGPDENGIYTLDISKVGGVSGERWWANEIAAKARTPSMISREPALRIDRQPFVDESNPVSDYYLELRRVWADPAAGVGYIVADRPEDDKIVFVSDNIAEPPRSGKPLPEDIARYASRPGATTRRGKRQTQLSMRVDDFNYTLKKAGVDLRIMRPESGDDRDTVMETLKHLKIGTSVFKGEGFVVEDRRTPKTENIVTDMKTAKEVDGPMYFWTVNKEGLAGLTERDRREAEKFMEIFGSKEVFSVDFAVDKGRIDYVGVTAGVGYRGGGGSQVSASISIGNLPKIFKGVSVTERGIRFANAKEIGPRTAPDVAAGIMKRVRIQEAQSDGKAIFRRLASDVIATINVIGKNYPKMARTADFYP